MNSVKWNAFIGKIAIVRQGVNTPPFQIRDEVYELFNSQLEENGFKCRFSHIDFPVAVVMKRFKKTSDRSDSLNFFRWGQTIIVDDLIEEYPEINEDGWACANIDINRHTFKFPKVFPRNIFWGKREGDEVFIENKNIDFKLTCSQYEYQTPDFVNRYGLTSLETMFKIESGRFSHQRRQYDIRV